ncbi:hypothetical protein [Halosimplex amylolyticum]
MDLVMCTGCGVFTPAAPGEVRRPIADECPRCAGVTFRDTDAGRTVRAD